jgi:hypothetical protein
MAMIVGLGLVASAGLASAAYSGQSIWGDDNPGLGLDYAKLPDAGFEHNQAGAVHPPDFAGQPDDLPPDHAGAPDDLPDQANDNARDHYPPDGVA